MVQSTFLIFIIILWDGQRGCYLHLTDEEPGVYEYVKTQSLRCQSWNTYHASVYKSPESSIQWVLNKHVANELI